MNTPILFITLFALFLAPAAHSVGGSEEAFAKDLEKKLQEISGTAGEIHEKLKKLKAACRKCSDSCEKNVKCPKTISQGMNKKFVDPNLSLFEKAKKDADAKAAEIREAFVKPVSQDDLEKVGACKGQSEVLVSNYSKKKKALDDASKFADKLARDTKAELDKIYKEGPEFNATFKRCATEVANANFVTYDWAKKYGYVPAHRHFHDVLADTFSRDEKHPDCPDNAVKIFREVTALRAGAKIGLMDKLAAKSKEMSVAFTQHSKNLEVKIASEEAKLLAANCGTLLSSAEAQRPDVSGTGEHIAAKEGEGTVKKDREADIAAAEESGLVPATKAKAKEPVAEADKGAGTAAAMAVLSKKDQEPTQQPPKATMLNGEDAGKEAQASTNGEYRALRESEGNVTSEAPGYAMNVGQGTAAAWSQPAPVMSDERADEIKYQAMRNTYSQDPVFANNDLDFKSTHDSKIIQRTINEVRAQNGQPPIEADGFLGPISTSALDSIMQDPVQKAAYYQAMRAKGMYGHPRSPASAAR